jgi:hypothetical protein
MKSKNLILGLIAFVFAAGSALASLMAPVDAYAETKLSSPGENWACKKIGQCSGSSGTTCMIAVPIQVAPYSKTVIAKPPLTCPSGTLQHESTNPIFGDIEFYDVR